jgi:hypothetical protein
LTRPEGFELAPADWEPLAASGVSCRRQFIGTVNPHHRGKQSQRIGSTSVGKAATLDLVGKRLSLLSDHCNGTAQCFTCQTDLQVLGHLVPIGEHCMVLGSFASWSIPHLR